MDTKDKNKLMLEFLNVPVYSNDYDLSHVLKPFHILKGQRFFNVNNVLFNVSLDWLKPVIDKISTLPETQESGQLYECKYNIKDALYYDNVSSIFETVVQFIEEYNVLKGSETFFASRACVQLVCPLCENSEQGESFESFETFTLVRFDGQRAEIRCEVCGVSSHHYA
jgi:hypothetical protein